MTPTANDVLNAARAWHGYSEANGKFKEILNVYNAHRPLARNYAIKPSDEWCDCFVSACAIKAGAVSLIGTEVGCEEHVAIFKKLGIWVEDGTVVPEPGHIILYNWDKKTQPNDGRSDHIGYVEEVDLALGVIYAIEGNKGEAVARRAIPIGWGYIRGYAAPKYAKESEETNMTGKEIYEALMSYLSEQPTSEYARESSAKGVKSGLFVDGDKDGLVDAPKGILTREQLSVVLNRAGMLDK